MRRLLPILLALLLLSACAQPTDAPEESYTPKYTDALLATPSPSVEPGVQLDAPLITAIGDHVQVDLDSDGRQDDICLGRAEDRTLTLTVNDTDFTRVLYDAYDFDFADSDYYAVVNIDAADRALEIAVEDFGPSDDSQTFFFRYADEALQTIGSVPGLVWDDWTKAMQVRMPGNGEVQLTARLSGLMTWFGDVRYALQGGRLALVSEPVYYASSGVDVTLTDTLRVYDAKDGDGTILYPNERLQLVGTDQREWVLAYHNGAQVWVHLNPDNTMEVETDDGFLSGDKVMRGLLFAD